MPAGLAGRCSGMGLEDPEGVLQMIQAAEGEKPEAGPEPACRSLVSRPLALVVLLASFCPVGFKRCENFLPGGGVGPRHVLLKHFPIHVDWSGHGTLLVGRVN